MSEGGKTAFVICPIGKEGGASRQKSDKLLKYVIREVLEPKEYIVERADQLSEPGIITNQIVQKIVACDVLIADLSEGNPNVFYELAIRHGLKKPFIHMIASAEKIPFDNAQVRTIQFDLTDLDSVSNAKRELAKQIESIENNKENAESPISVAFDLEQLRSSDNTDQSVLASLFDEVASMRADIRALRRTPSGIRTIEGPRNDAELRDLVNTRGDPELVRQFESASITAFEPGKILLTTSLAVEDDPIFEKRLSQFLNRHSRQRWEVHVLPF